jgi:hypothetical protein
VADVWGRPDPTRQPTDRGSHRKQTTGSLGKRLCTVRSETNGSGLMNPWPNGLDGRRARTSRLFHAAPSFPEPSGLRVRRRDFFASPFHFERLLIILEPDPGNRFEFAPALFGFRYLHSVTLTSLQFIASSN